MAGWSRLWYNFEMENIKQESQISNNNEQSFFKRHKTVILTLIITVLIALIYYGVLLVLNNIEDNISKQCYSAAQNGVFDEQVHCLNTSSQITTIREIISIPLFLTLVFWPVFLPILAVILILILMWAHKKDTGLVFSGWKTFLYLSIFIAIMIFILWFLDDFGIFRFTIA